MYECLKKECCLMDLQASTRDEAIREMSEMLVKAGQVLDKEVFIKDILEREERGTTGIGLQVAVPHAPTEAVDNFVLGFGRSEKGLDFASMDGDKVHLVFIMGTNPEKLVAYLKYLAALSRLLRKSEFRKALMEAATAEEVLKAFKKFETA